MVLAIKTIFIHSPESFNTSQLSLLPDPLSNPNFTEDFMAYIPQDEWNHFMVSSVSVAFYYLAKKLFTKLYGYLWAQSYSLQIGYCMCHDEAYSYV